MKLWLLRGREGQKAKKLVDGGAGAPRHRPAEAEKAPQMPAPNEVALFRIEPEVISVPDYTRCSPTRTWSPAEGPGSIRVESLACAEACPHCGQSQILHLARGGQVVEMLIE